MTAERAPRDRQRGNSLLLALIVMSVLATLGSLTVISVQSSLKTSTNDRSETIARYAAESGAAVAMDFLRRNFLQGAGWSAYVQPNNEPTKVVPLGTPDLPSSGALPGTLDNLFSIDQNAWYSVEILNNRNDPGFAAASGSNDTDGQVVIRSTGHGPQGSVAIIEWEVQRIPLPQPPPNLPLVPTSQPLVLMGWHVVL
jgi:type II secretory pathway pseudopilin PulG